MAIAIVYKKILDLQLWHDYYLGQPDALTSLPANYDISNLLAIEPTPDCWRLLKNLRWVFRTQPQGASIFAPVNEVTAGEFQTQIPIDLPERLTFGLIVRDRYFANFTNLPLGKTSTKIYYFSNFTGNQLSPLLFLTQPLPTYARNAEYDLGQLVNRSGKTLEAVEYQAKAGNTPDPSKWNTLPDSQYVSALDYLPPQARSRSYSIPKANPGETFRLKLVDVNGLATFAVEVIVSDLHPPGSPLSIDLNFTGQIPGRYQLILNDTEVDNFVLVDPLANRNAFGLVEIGLNSSLVTPAFALLQPVAGQTMIRPKTYLIRFKNRMTRWRYNYELPHRLNPESIPSFNLIDDKTYATKQLLGLRLQPTPQITPQDPRLPSPSVILIKPEINTEQHITTIFSDIHL